MEWNFPWQAYFAFYWTRKWGKRAIPLDLLWYIFGLLMSPLYSLLVVVFLLALALLNLALCGFPLVCFNLFKHNQATGLLTSIGTSVFFIVGLLIGYVLVLVNVVLLGLPLTGMAVLVLYCLQKHNVDPFVDT